MKKLLALLAVVLAVVSCQKEINGLAVDSNGEAAVSLSVALPEGATRAAGADSALGAIDNGVMNNYDVRFILEVYDMSGAEPELAKERMVQSGQSTTATFNFRLVPGRDYNFVVWADFVVKGSKEDRLYNTEDGLDEIEMYHKLWDAIDESRDAYTESVRVDNYNGTSKIGENGVITLTRPFAKLRVVTNDIKEMISIRPKTVTVKYFSTEFYAKYNALSETPYNAVEFDKELVVTLLDDQNNPVDVYTGEKPDSTSVQTLFADYFFASQEGDRVMFTMDVETNHGPAIPQVTFNTNIPVKRNNLTTVYGPILTDANNVSVTINPAFENGTNWNPGDDKYDVEVWDGMTVTEPAYDANTKTYTVTNGAHLAWIADQVNGVTRAAANTFKGKTIKLVKDINLGGNRWTPIGVNGYDNIFNGTFDGQGHTIANLVVNNNKCAGLFGGTTAGTFKNLTIDGVELITNHFAGAIVAWTESGSAIVSIDNCHVKNAKITVTPELVNGKYDNGDKAGAIVGHAYATDINRCTAENIEITAFRDVAGIAGYATKRSITNCSVKNAVITSDQIHEYDGDKDGNAGVIAGRIANPVTLEGNTTGENVVVIRKVDSTKELEYAVADAKSGDTIYIGGEVTMPYFADKALNFVGVEKNAVVKQSPADHLAEHYAGAELNFDNLTLVGTSYTGDTQGYQKASVETYVNCHFVNYIMFAGDVTTVTDCTFENEGQYFWTGTADNITFTRCKFNGLERAVKVCTVGNAGARVATFNNCEFKATNPVKSALEIDGSKGSSYVVNINNCTAEGFAVGAYTGESLFEIEGAENVTIKIDGNTWVGKGLLENENGDQIAYSEAGLKEALENGGTVVLANPFTIDQSESNGYGKTGINMTNGGTLDGNGNELGAPGSTGTWDSAINTSGGTIKNIKVTKGFRGIFIKKDANHNEKLYLNKVTIDGTTYTISCDSGNGYGLEATNSTFKGWTSYAATIGEVKFDTCTFGAGNGYNFSRPYAPTQYVNCTFEAGHKMDPRAAVTFENCTVGGVALTAENLSTLVTSNIANASVK